MPRLAKPILEKDMRSWLRDNWKGGLHFIEHNFGGTSGISDAQLILNGRITPCELKKGNLSRAGDIIMEIRSRQRDYHRECYEYGIGTIVLVMLDGNVMGGVGYKVVIEAGSWPKSLWKSIETHDDLVALIDSSWRYASRRHGYRTMMIKRSVNKAYG